MSLDARIGLHLGSLELDVELRIADGEVVALLGPNGAGKSTVLRVLAGLVALDTGRVIIDDAVVDEPAVARFVPPEDRSVGMVFQDYLLFEHMSVLENVAYGLRARRTPRVEARRRAGEWLERVGLGAYADARPHTLSGGQAQRVALARALAASPQLFLLDEPLAALDVGTRAAVRRELRRHLDEFAGMSVLVTHDPTDAFALADRIAIIENGRIAQTGTFAEVTVHPRSRYVADLVGVNLLSGTVAADVLTTASGAEVVVVDTPPGDVYAVIRPQAVVIARAMPSASSARNTWPGTITDIDRLGDRARLSLDGPLPLIAEITVAALDHLALRPGDEVYASVKATEIGVMPA